LRSRPAQISASRRDLARTEIRQCNNTATPRLEAGDLLDGPRRRDLRERAPCAVLVGPSNAGANKPEDVSDFLARFGAHGGRQR